MKFLMLTDLRYQSTRILKMMPRKAGTTFLARKIVQTFIPPKQITMAFHLKSRITILAVHAFSLVEDILNETLWQHDTRSPTSTFFVRTRGCQKQRVSQRRFNNAMNIVQ